MRPTFQRRESSKDIAFAATEQRVGAEADRKLIAAVHSSDLPGEIDEKNGWTQSGDYEDEVIALAFHLASTVVAEVFNFTWRNGCHSGRLVDEAFRRFFAVTKVLRPDLLIPPKNTEPLSCQEIGTMCGVSRCSISKLAELFSRQWGVHARFQKLETSRGSYRDATNAAWRKKRGLDLDDEVPDYEPSMDERIVCEAAVRVSRGSVILVFAERKPVHK